MRNSARLPACVAVCLTLANCSLARQELYAPRPGPVDIAKWADVAPRPATVRTDDGISLDGYYWPGASGDRDVFVFFHGRGSHQGVGARYAQHLRGRGDAVMVASYRGFGGNPGKPSRTGMEKDAAAFIARAKELVGPGARVWLVGHSLGGAVALDAAAGRSDIAGVILISAFARLSDAAPWYTRPFLPDRWNNLAEVPQLKVPLLIVQGDRDDVIPAESGAKLSAAAKGPSAYVRMGGVRHKPPMQTLGPWLSEAITDMEDGHMQALPSLPDGWSLVSARP